MQWLRLCNRHHNHSFDSIRFDTIRSDSFLGCNLFIILNDLTTYFQNLHNSKDCVLIYWDISLQLEFQVGQKCNFDQSSSLFFGMETFRGQWLLVDIFFQNGQIFVDIVKGWILVDTFWWILVDTFVHEKSSFWVNFRGHFLGEFLWTFWVNFRGHLIVMIRVTLLSSNKLTQT